MKKVSIGLIFAALFLIAACSSGSDDSGQVKPTPGDEVVQNLPTYIFARHRFANPTDEISLEMGSKRYREAAKFMIAQTTALKKQVNLDHNGSNFMQDLVAPIDHDYMLNSGLTIDDTIDDNNTKFAPYMAQMIYKLSEADRAKFRACYDMLAVRAYQDSLGQISFDNTTTAQELPAIQDELQNAGVVNNYTEIEDTMQTLIKQIATATNTQPKTLKMAVEMALYNEGLWGFRDSTASGVSKDPVYMQPGSYTDIGQRRRAAFANQYMGIVDNLDMQNMFSLGM